MEYRLTFHGLVIGSLAVGLTILATAWVLQGLARIQERWGRRTDRSDAPFDDDGGYWRAREHQPAVKMYGSLAFEKPRSARGELGLDCRRTKG